MDAPLQFSLGTATADSTPGRRARKTAGMASRIPTKPSTATAAAGVTAPAAGSLFAAAAVAAAAAKALPADHPPFSSAAGGVSAPAFHLNGRQRNEQGGAFTASAPTMGGVYGGDAPTGTAAAAGPGAQPFGSAAPLAAPVFQLGIGGAKSPPSARKARPAAAAAGSQGSSNGGGNSADGTASSMAAMLGSGVAARFEGPSFGQVSRATLLSRYRARVVLAGERC